MKILLWLAVPLAVTALAMLWAAWAGRPRREDPNDERAYERFSAAITRPVPAKARNVVKQHSERPSGVAVRPSRRRSGVR